MWNRCKKNTIIFIINCVRIISVVQGDQFQSKLQPLIKVPFWMRRSDKPRGKGFCWYNKLWMLLKGESRGQRARMLWRVPNSVEVEKTDTLIKKTKNNMGRNFHRENVQESQTLGCMDGLQAIFRLDMPIFIYSSMPWCKKKEEKTRKMWLIVTRSNFLATVRLQ